MTDYLVRLYNLPNPEPYYKCVQDIGVVVHRPLTADKKKVIDFIRTNFHDNWAEECESIFGRSPIPCYIARKNNNIIGFACYDAVCMNFFGPTGVASKFRGKGIGAALLLKCLYDIRSDGFGYAIIGWGDGGKDFYQRIVGATAIEGSDPGIYKDLLET